MEANESLGQARKLADEYYRIWIDKKISGNEMEIWLIEEFLIKKIKKEMEAKKFEIESWANKLKMINGGKNRIKIDIDAIKKIPIEKILSIRGIQNNRGMFKVRNEKTPSCHFDKDKNLWIDYGSGEGGSVIDLYMKINNYNFKEAIKELSNIL